MSTVSTCKHCGVESLRWRTVRTQLPIDVLECTACQERLLEEDWVPPLLPLRAGRCLNCAEDMNEEACGTCGLSAKEGAQVHDELRQLVRGEGTLLEAAREATRMGRRLLALKLATAAAAAPGSEAELARALRVWLLSAVGEPQAALEDARAWVKDAQAASALAWGSLGQQYQQCGFPGSAADALQKALKRAPDQHPLRARRAQLLMQMNREGQASEEACAVLEAQADDKAIGMALEVAEQLAERYASQSQDDELQRLLTRAGAYAERSPKLLAQRALLAAHQGEVYSAKRDLKMARRLDPHLEAYEKVEAVLKPLRSSWWRW